MLKNRKKDICKNSARVLKNLWVTIGFKRGTHS